MVREEPLHEGFTMVYSASITLLYLFPRTKVLLPSSELYRALNALGPRDHLGPRQFGHAVAHPCSSPGPVEAMSHPSTSDKSFSGG